MTLDDLVAERSRLTARLDEIDAELLKRGVRMQSRGKRPRVAAALIIATLERGSRTTAQIQQRTGHGKGALLQMLHKLSKAGEIQRVARGRYALPRKAA